eukprot:2597717-Rhodomonas_salina.10
MSVPHVAYCMQWTDRDVTCKLLRSCGCGRAHSRRHKTIPCFFRRVCSTKIWERGSAPYKRRRFSVALMKGSAELLALPSLALSLSIGNHPTV